MLMTPTIRTYSFECFDAAQLAEFLARVKGKGLDFGTSADYATLDLDAGDPTLDGRSHC
jgi:hypothetical protein